MRVQPVAARYGDVTEMVALVAGLLVVALGCALTFQSMAAVAFTKAVAFSITARSRTSTA